MRLWIGLAGVNGFLAVAAAAALAHGVEIADLAMARAMVAAVMLHLAHTLALFGVGLLMAIAPSRLLIFAGAAFQTGALLFSGALYVYALAGAQSFAMAAPFGGVAFMLGWAALILAALKIPASSN